MRLVNHHIRIATRTFEVERKLASRTAAGWCEGSNNGVFQFGPSSQEVSINCGMPHVFSNAGYIHCQQWRNVEWPMCGFVGTLLLSPSH